MAIRVLFLHFVRLISRNAAAAGNNVTAVTVDVILPCLNEAPAVPWMLERMPAGFRPIVVDNGSADGSDEIARSFGAMVVAEPTRGFGAAAHAGLLAATSDLVCFCDLDGSLDPRQLPLITGPLLAGQADLVLGRRAPVRRDAWPLPARLANWELARRVRRRTGLSVRDLGPMRAAGREALLSLNLADRRFGYPLEMVMNAAAAGWRVSEVEVAYLPRVGKSKVTGTVRGCVRTVHDMSGVLAR
jgi:glycosyltransferase involved in cell wall biosynthesis